MMDNSGGNLQILTILTGENPLWAVRLFDIQKILSPDLLVPGEGTGPSFAGWLEEGKDRIPVYDPRRWKGTVPSSPPGKLLLIGSPSGKRFGVAVEKLGKVLRIREDDLRPGTPLEEGFGCLTGPLPDGGELRVINPDPAGEKISASKSQKRKPPAETTPQPDDFVTQIGKTAREIQKILSMSDSMLDTMKLVGDHLPTTSGGLETVSRMTEDAAHTILSVLESSLETNQKIRSDLQKMASDPKRLRKDLPAIEQLLSGQETRILEGFEAMAFQDLVGQNLRKITGTLNDLEKRLLEILMEFSVDREPEKGEKTDLPRSAVKEAQNLELKGVPSESAFTQDSVDKLLSEFGF